jgi:hypothetical protein
VKDWLGTRLGTIDVKVGRHRKSRAEWYEAEGIDHPAKMSVELAGWAIDHFLGRALQPGSGRIVWDPMAGTGTTIVEALRRGHLGFGWELEPRWARVAGASAAKAAAKMQADGYLVTGDVSRANVLEVYGVLRSLREPPGRADLVLVSPPFGPTSHHPGRRSALQAHIIASKRLTGAHDAYGSSPGQLGSDKVPLGEMAPAVTVAQGRGIEQHPTYLEGLAALLVVCRCVAKVGAPIVVHVRNYVRQGVIVALDERVAALGRAAGMDYEGHWARPIQPTYWQRVQRKRNPAYPFVQVEQLLVLRRAF